MFIGMPHSHTGNGLRSCAVALFRVSASGGGAIVSAPHPNIVNRQFVAIRVPRGWSFRVRVR